MQISQRCHYGLLALYELALCHEGEARSVSEIAEAQTIPPPFLQAILRQLRQGGFVESKRGKAGGYRLARPARSISMRDVIQFFEGEMAPVDLQGGRGGSMPGRHPFAHAFGEAAQALHAVYDKHTLAEIVQQRQNRADHGAPDYII